MMTYIVTYRLMKHQLDIHPNNRKRVLRAIEYYLKTKTFKFSKESSTIYENYDTLLVGIEMSRKTLYKNK